MHGTGEHVVGFLLATATAGRAVHDLMDHAGQGRRVQTLGVPRRQAEADVGRVDALGQHGGDVLAELAQDLAGRALGAGRDVLGDEVLRRDIRAGRVGASRRRRNYLLLATCYLQSADRSGRRRARRRVGRAESFEMRLVAAKVAIPQLEIAANSDPITSRCFLCST